MKRNSGRIGIKSAVALSAASGVFDTFDAYNFKKSGNWPLAYKINSLSPSPGTILENTNVFFSLNTSGFETSTTVYWTVLNGSSTNADFLINSGAFTHSDTVPGNFTLRTAFTGDVNKTTKTFQVQIRTDSISGPIIHTTGTYSIPAITSSVTWTNSPINEGATTNLSVTLGNVGNYSLWNANISYSGTANSGDFSSFPSTMLVYIGTRTESFTAVSDFTTEGSETLTASVSYAGYPLGSALLNINDTSTNATATVTPTLTSVNEDGTAVTFNVSTTSFTSGTLYYTTLNTGGSISAADFTQGSTTGSFTVTSSTGSFAINIAADAVTEGTESFQIQVRLNSTSGTVIGTSATVTISDTSLGPSATVTPTLTSVNEDGTAVTFNVSTINFTAGTLYYTVQGISGTLSAGDFTQGSTTGSFTIASSAGSFVLNIAADTATEGIESFQVQVRTNSQFGTIIGTSATVTVSDTSNNPSQPAYITLGTRAPYFSAGGYSIFPPTGYTALQNASVDDGNVNFTTPFSIVINGTSYSTHYFGSNTYITWGSGSNNYSGLNATNPPFNKLMMGAADNSYQRVSTTTAGTSYTRVRYEGNGSTSGSVGSPGIVLEVTFFNPANYGGVPVIEVLVGNHNRTAGVTGICTTNAFMLQWTTAFNTSYVLVGNATGTTWTRYLGYINNSGY